MVSDTEAKRKLNVALPVLWNPRLVQTCLVELLHCAVAPLNVAPVKGGKAPGINEGHNIRRMEIHEV